MRYDLGQLPNDPVLLQQMVRDLSDTLEERRRKIEQLQQRVADLLRERYGRSSEKLDGDQLKLALDEVAAALSEAMAPEEATAAAPVPEPPAAPPPKKGHGRNKLPDSLPRDTTEHLPAEVLLKCECGCTKERIGEETSERLDYKPACFRVLRNVRPKFACPDCSEGVVIAPPPAAVIEKGLATAGLLAYIIVSKYADHLPLARLEAIFERHGIWLSRKTMAGWVDTVASLLEPIVAAMLALVLTSRKLHTDDTPVPVLDRTRDRTREGRLWVFVGDEAHPYIVYGYSPDKKQDYILKLLGGYEGYLQADAAPGYDKLFAKKTIVEVGCWMHARRGFHDALGSDDLRALMAMAFIRLLYAVEDEAQKLDDEGRKALRQEKSKPILAQLKVWLEEERPKVLPQSPIGEAIGYTINQWAALNLYCEHGFLDIDNGISERELRRIGTGRNNWLFAGSDQGGERAAVLYSLVATCKRHNVEPWAYIADVLERISTHPASKIEELFPERWKSLRTVSPDPDPPPETTSSP